jgi:phosphatidylethanolamine/phosphatidyl-N-methylethanolamine N-methyltransferase
MIEEALRRLKTKNSEGGAVAVLDERSVVEAYARWAPIYDALFGVITWGGRRAALGTVNALPAARVLEAGVGTGISLPGYHARHRIVGIDLSPDMLERAERRVERRQLRNVEAIRRMDAGHLTMGDASLDVVVAMYVMTVVPEPERVLDEFARVIRPGGRLVIVNHFASERYDSPTAGVERVLSRFAAKLGWEARFPIERITSHPELRLLEKRKLHPFGLFTLLVFERR